jgi:uncharacterized membrane protein YebE (DUF533 family)
MQLTKAMLSVALVDGLHPTESALIHQFYDSARSAEMPPADAVMEGNATQQYKVSELAGSSPEFADTLVLMCLMTGYADGNLSPAEREHINSIVAALGMTEQQLAAHLAHVQNDLIGALSHLPDSASVAKVFGEL